MRNLFFLLFLLFIKTISFSQILIEGKVLDQKSKSPIPFVNIGIIGSNVGTLSNQDGSFSLRAPEKFLNDSIIFSSLGFEKKSMPTQLLITKPGQVVFLSEKAVLLNEVSVKVKKMKAKTVQLGNTSIKGGVLQSDTLYSGRSVALLIENKNPEADLEFPLYLTSARLHIFRNNLKSIRFRIRVNEVDAKTGLPGNDILQQNIIQESTLRRGWLEFDLSSLNLVISKPFFITFEQLTTKEDRIAIANGYRDFITEHPNKVKYDTVVFDGKKSVRQTFKGGGIDVPGTFLSISSSKDFSCYVREVSLADWEKVRGIVTATVMLSTQPRTLIKN